MGDKALGVAKDVGREAVRIPAKIGIDTLFFIPDMATAAANAVPGLGPKVEAPSNFWGRQLDKLIAPPASKMGKFEEEGLSMAGTGGVAGLAKGAEKAAARRGVRALEPEVPPRPNVVTTQAAHDVHIAGYDIDPKYIGGPVRKQMQTFSGGPKMSDAISAKNEPVTDRLAGLSVALPPGEALNAENLAHQEKLAYQPYEEIRKLGYLKTSHQFDLDVEAAGGPEATHGPDYGKLDESGAPEGTARYQSIEDLKNKYRGRGAREVRAGGTLDEIQSLRKNAKAHLRQYDPEKNALGKTELAIAKAMEDRIDRHVGDYATRQMGNYDPTLVDRLREARTKLSQLYYVELSLGAGNHVKASDFAALEKAGVKLTDGLDTIAKMAKHFPDSVKAVAKKGETGDWSAVDYLLGGSGLVTGHVALAVPSVARKVMRSALTSEGAQKAMIRNLGKEPGAVSKAAAGAMKGGSEGVKALGRGAVIRGAESLGQTPDMGQNNGP